MAKIPQRIQMIFKGVIYLVFWVSFLNVNEQVKPTDLANPFIDTHNSRWFYHSEFEKGGTLEIELGQEPNKKWGTKDLIP